MAILNSRVCSNKKESRLNHSTSIKTFIKSHKGSEIFTKGERDLLNSSSYTLARL